MSTGLPTETANTKEQKMISFDLSRKTADDFSSDLFLNFNGSDRNSFTISAHEFYMALYMALRERVGDVAHVTISKKTAKIWVDAIAATYDHYIDEPLDGHWDRETTLEMLNELYTTLYSALKLRRSRRTLGE